MGRGGAGGGGGDGGGGMRREGGLTQEVRFKRDPLTPYPAPPPYSPSNAVRARALANNSASPANPANDSAEFCKRELSQGRGGKGFLKGLVANVADSLLVSKRYVLGLFWLYVRSLLALKGLVGRMWRIHRVFPRGRRVRKCVVKSLQ